jgi:hypothetical protein
MKLNVEIIYYYRLFVMNPWKKNRRKYFKRLNFDFYTGPGNETANTAKCLWIRESIVKFPAVGFIHATYW